MTELAVIDTNVVVAGLISGSADSPVCRVLDGMLVGTFPFLLSTELLEEYRSVLLRPNLRKLHGLSAGEVDAVLTDIAVNAVVREPQVGPALRAPDRGDDHLWQLLATAPGSTLVTGDRALLASPPEFAHVLSPRVFIDSVSGR